MKGVILRRASEVLVVIGLAVILIQRVQNIQAGLPGQVLGLIGSSAFTAGIIIVLVQFEYMADKARESWRNAEALLAEVQAEHPAE